MGCSLARQTSYDFPPDAVLPCGGNEPWKNVHSASLIDWNTVDAKLWNFTMDVGIPGSKYNNPLQPWSTATQRYDVLLPAPIEQSDLNVAYAHDEIQISWNWQKHTIKLERDYKHRLLPKYRTAPILDSAQVIGSRRHVVVIQIVCKDVMEFLLVNLNSDMVIGKYSETYDDRPYLFEGLVSPDLNHFILKPNLLYVLKNSIQCVDDRIRVLQPVPPDTNDVHNMAIRRCSSEGSVNSTELSVKKLKRLAERRRSNFPCYDTAARLFQDQGLDLILAYDPRYRHSKIAISNLTKRTQHVICMYCLKQKRIVQKVFGPQFQRTQNLVFSPDGEYLASLVVTYILGPKMYPQRFDFLCVMVYSSDGLELLHRIKCFGTSGLTCLTPAACFPLFSTDGAYITVGAGAGTCINRVDVYSMPIHVTLRNLCRLKIRRLVTETEIEGSAVAASLKDFLLYRPTTT